MRTLVALAVLLAGCADSGPGGSPPPDDTAASSSDPCADEADGTVVDPGVGGACEGFVHACDASGTRSTSALVCEGG